MFSFLVICYYKKVQLNKLTQQSTRQKVRHPYTLIEKKMYVGKRDPFQDPYEKLKRDPTPKCRNHCEMVCCVIRPPPSLQTTEK